jgi:hypothetical protein
MLFSLTPVEHTNARHSLQTLAKSGQTHRPFFVVDGLPVAMNRAARNTGGHKNG